MAFADPEVMRAALLHGSQKPRAAGGETAFQLLPLRQEPDAVTDNLPGSVTRSKGELAWLPQSRGASDK